MRYQAGVQLSPGDTAAHPEYGYLRILITFECSASWKRESQLLLCSYVNCALNALTKFSPD